VDDQTAGQPAIDPSWEPEDMYTMTSLEQVKVVADPLRVSILEALCLEARTTKQVAEILGEKPTRLYHHMDALSEAGLIRLVDTRQVRGTVEKYYRSVGRAFRADPAIFRQADADDEQNQALADVAATMLERTTQEVRRLILSGHDLTSGEEGILSFVEVRGSESEIEEINQRLMKFLKDLEEDFCGGEPNEEHRRYRLNLAWFPLDRTDDEMDKP
jgi:DNA-binding transcriptional ArsR family regulator